jgi:hypothetical protein
MTTKRWDFRDEDLRRYTVEVDHGYWSGKRVVTANGREVVRERKTFGFDMGSQHGFEVDGHAALLRIRTQGVTYMYDLYVDGIAIAPQGTTIPRAGSATSPVQPDTSPPQVALAATPVNPAADLEQRVRNGGRWFYWIAGLSAVNLVFFVMGSNTGFALGTSIDWLIQGVLEELADPSLAWIAHVAVIAFFAFLGVRATAGAQWAFILGGVVYAVDGLLLLLVGDWIGIVVHVVALFAIVTAITSLRQLRRTVPAATLQPY